MRPENKRMMDFLKSNGITAKVKYIPDGSLKHTWRIYNGSTPWNEEIRQKLIGLGFRDNNGGDIHKYAGNGGVLSVFVRGHYELLDQPA